MITFIGIFSSGRREEKENDEESLASIDFGESNEEEFVALMAALRSSVFTALLATD